ncbi:MAG: sterol desaturase family protein [Blastocatellales bacterium]
MIDPNYMPTVLVAGGLILLWTLESWIPAAKDRRDRMRHAARNLTLGLINAVALALFAAPLISWVAGWAEESGLGLLRLFNLPPLASTIAAVLLMDAWMYLWHRANHEIPFLWRFHRAHHSDPEMDATTAIRFHAGEILISSALRLAVIPLLGISLWQLLVYESLLLPVILFHHSNVNFPEKLDRRLRFALVSPAIHRVHHSRASVEFNSNYSSVFSFWDRIAGTFRLRRDGQPVKFGLDEYEGERWQKTPGLLITPFVSAERNNGINVDAAVRR